MPCWSTEAPTSCPPPPHTHMSKPCSSPNMDSFNVQVVVMADGIRASSITTPSFKLLFFEDIAHTLMTLMLSCPPSKCPDLLRALGGDSQGSNLPTTFLALRRIVMFAKNPGRARAHLFQLCRVGEAGIVCERKYALSLLCCNNGRIFLFVQLGNSLFHTVHW